MHGLLLRLLQGRRVPHDPVATLDGCGSHERKRLIGYHHLETLPSPMGEAHLFS
ncbi:Uncharacterized protein APZ42_021584 [Daphnia magna]|uniref:Uncharacterized protein n=1 Tax=Daphnia magna TaxID=35525 RepID=A0A162CA39_9CRUS|nr:Uncharacterized protein APZ42_021584 [Daphnia magna]